MDFYEKDRYGGGRGRGLGGGKNVDGGSRSGSSVNVPNDDKYIVCFILRAAQLGRYGSLNVISLSSSARFFVVDLHAN